VSWLRIPLGQVLTLKRGYDLAEGQRLEGTIPVVSSAGITGYHSSAKADGPGVVTGRYGTLGEVYYVQEAFWPLNTALYVADFKKTNRRFAAYLLEYVLANRGSETAAVPGVNRNTLHAIEVLCPDRSIQDAAAELIGAYDDLIDVNRRRMALLERAARELYQEWFGRLRFPGYEHAHTERGIPVGWRELPLRTITTKIGSGSTPRGGEASYTSEGVALIRSQNVHDYRFELSGLAHLRQEQADALISVSVEPNDTLVNITGASVARCCMVPLSVLPARVNQHVMIVRPNRELVDPHYLQQCLASDRHKRQLLSFAQKGSTREALTREMMANYSILVPSREVMSVFGDRLALFEEQRETLDRQNQHLLTARNLLLQRLMRGELLT
jgi:type I restriction enzyme S subunit